MINPSQEKSFVGSFFFFLVDFVIFQTLMTIRYLKVIAIFDYNSKHIFTISNNCVLELLFSLSIDSLIDFNKSNHIRLFYA